jgi:integrase
MVGHLRVSLYGEHVGALQNDVAVEDLSDPSQPPFAALHARIVAFWGLSRGRSGDKLILPRRAVLVAIGRGQQRREQALQSIEEQVGFAGALLLIRDLFVLHRNLSAQKFVLAFKARDIAIVRRCLSPLVGACRSSVSRLRTFFGWAIANDLTEGDPTAGVRKPAKEVARNRVLTDEEIIAFWSGTEQLGAPFGHLFRLLLLTAQRKSEVAGIRWSELDLAGRIWTIPGARAKNGKPHMVHLNALACEVLEEVPRVTDQDLLFSGNGRTPASGFSKPKDRLDAAIMVAAGWVLHDLRRTAITGMARLGIAPHVADRVLNHQAGTIRGVAAVYNQFAYVDERRAALEAWGRFVESLVRPVPSNVVPLTATR